MNFYIFIFFSLVLILNGLTEGLTHTQIKHTKAEDSLGECEGSIKEFAPTLIPILSSLVLSPEDTCSFLGFCDTTQDKLEDFILRGSKKLASDHHQTSSSSNELSKIPVYSRKETPLMGNQEPAGWFLQIADIHVDPLYAEGSSTDCTFPVCCRTEYGTGQGSAGRWGDYSCDIPYLTLQNMFDELSIFPLKPDFIVYTGDTPPHDIWSQSTDSVLENIFNISNMMDEAFPGIPVISAIGNHDTFPVDQFNNHPIDSSHHDDFQWLKDGVAKAWGRWLSDDAVKTLRAEGYYSTLVTPGLRVVSINTQWTDSLNFYLLLGGHPSANQSAWLIQTLMNARLTKEKIIMIAHIPPGSTLPNSPYVIELLEIAANYSDVILAQLYGHTHNDEFQIITGKKSEPVSVAYVAPSVTSFTNKNPSFRFYKYNTTTFEILDYYQYYMNLTAANLSGKTNWELEYSAKEEYGLPDLSAASWMSLTQQFLSNSTLFQMWWNNYNTRVPGFTCDTGCTAYYVCKFQNANPSSC